MALEPAGFALVGMAAIFTAIVRAPLTAIVLVTANVTLLLPMIVTCFVAMLVPTLFGDRSILDALKARMLAHARKTLPEVDQPNRHK